MVGRKYILRFLITGILLFASNLLFSAMESIQAQSNLKRVEAIFQNPAIGTNPYLIVRDLMELQDRDLIACVSLEQLTPAHRDFVTQEMGTCKRTSFIRNFATISAPIKAANGSVWLVRFDSVNGSGFAQLVWAIRILLIFGVLVGFAALEQYQKRITEKQNLEFKHQQAITTLAREVAHDIRSPLSALSIALRAKEPTESHRALSISAINRINEIAEDLLTGTRATEQLKLSCLKPCVEEVVAELQAHKPDLRAAVEFQLTRGDSIIPVEAKKMKRLLSNLLSNSIEAVHGYSPEISVKIVSTKTDVSVEISDNGKGFPTNYSVITTKSVGKKDGNGLGLAQARRVIAEANGKMEIKNLLPFGASVKFQIPIII